MYGNSKLESQSASPFQSEFQGRTWTFCTVSRANSSQSFGLSQMRLGYETIGENLP